ncbi:MAG: CPBP family intramembrane metalloprotease [Maricaulaceae bacterium]|jgi:membrane protease YdiL (CAAX protease family)
MTLADAGQRERTATISKLAAVIDIAVVVAVSAGAFATELWARDAGLVPFGDDTQGVGAVLAGAAAALAVTFARGRSWRDLGFKRPRRWRTVPLWVIGILLTYVLVSVVAPLAVSQFVATPEPDWSRYAALQGNLPAALLMMALLPFTASIPEEIIYRGFLMGRLTAIFGEGAIGAVLAVLVQSLLFGFIHLFGWGVGGAIATAMMGAVWGTAFLLCGRNLWITVIAHSAGHVLMVLQLYAVGPT